MHRSLYIYLKLEENLCTVVLQLVKAKAIATVQHPNFELLQKSHASEFSYFTLDSFIFELTFSAGPVCTINTYWNLFSRTDP